MLQALVTFVNTRHSECPKCRSDFVGKTFPAESYRLRSTLRPLDRERPICRRNNWTRNRITFILITRRGQPTNETSRPSPIQLRIGSPKPFHDLRYFSPELSALFSRVVLRVFLVRLCLSSRFLNANNRTKQFAKRREGKRKEEKIEYTVWKVERGEK